MSKLCKIILAFILPCLSNASLAEVADPCGQTILSIFKRPTIITSTCPTPFGKYTFETGLQYNDFSNQTNGIIYPQMKVRMGLPDHNELAVVFPNENTSTKQASGLSAAQLALKHQIFSIENWSAAIRGIYIPRSGSKIYGTAHEGYTLNGIAAYRFYSFSAAVMGSYASLSTSTASGGKRYNTFSPDAIVAWYAKEWLQLYAEAYGQFHTAPDKGSGYNMNAGFLFLMTKNIAADIEVGHRISGKLGNFNEYYGTGISFMF